MNSNGERKLRVAAYCRVASPGESGRDLLTVQERYWTEQVANNPEWENAGIFSDLAPGTSMENRAGLNQMLRTCRDGKIDLILVRSVSRLGRKTDDVLRAIRELNRMGVNLIFEKESIDTRKQNRKD